MKPRPLTVIAFACLLTSCSYAQNHPYRTARSSELPPLPTIQLTQAIDEDLSDVLGTAQDLLDQLESGNTDNAEVETAPAPARPEPTPNLPRTLDEYNQEPVVDDLDGMSNDQAGEDRDGYTIRRRYEDVQPDPFADRRQRRPNNTPYSLGAILGDDDDISPCCEREFCRIMWSCAGGRCQDGLEQYKRNCRRNTLLRRSCNRPECLNGPFSEPFVCPQCRQAQHQQHSYGHPATPDHYGPHHVGPYTDTRYDRQPRPESNRALDAEAAYDDFSRYKGYRVINDRKAASTGDHDTLGRSSWSQRQQ